MIELADVESVLALFCEGIAGRYLHIRTNEEFGSRCLSLDPDGAAHTRDSLYLPARLDAPDPGAYRVLALEQIAYRECGTYRFSFDTALERWSDLAAGCLAIQGEGERSRHIGDLTRFFSCFTRPGLAREIFLLLEQARVQAHVFRTYPGITPHARRYFEHLSANADRHEDSPLECARWALLDAGPRMVSGALPGIVASTPRLAAALAHSARPGQDVYDSGRRTVSVYRELDPLMAAVADWELSPPDENLADWLQRDQRVDELENALEEMSGSMPAVPIGQSTDLEAEEGALEEGTIRDGELALEAVEKEREALARFIDTERSAVAAALGQIRAEGRSFRYDEWDHLNGRYLKHWCRLFEEKLVADNDAEVESLRQIIHMWRPAVQKPLERMRPLGLQRMRGVPDGDELDLNAIVEARQDIRAGRNPDERFYSRRERVHRDICAVFLVDLSASTDDPIEPSSSDPPDPAEPASSSGLYDPWSGWDDDPWDTEAPREEPKRKIIDVQREAMLVMAAALDALGDNYGIYGFSGNGRDCVEVFVAKEPHQAFTNETLRAIAAMKPKRSTRMGPAIRHATGKLIASGNAMKVLMVLSDGFPQDTDYGPYRGDHEYGVQDTAKAISEAQQKGVDTFCVTVDRSGHDYLKRMCPDERYLVIEEMEDLPGALSKVYGALTSR